MTCARNLDECHVHVQESGEPLELRPSDGVGQCAQPHLALERALRRPLSGDGHGSPLLKLLQHVPHDGAEHAIPVACKGVAAVRLAVRAHRAHQPQAAEVVGALRDQDDAREVPTVPLDRVPPLRAEAVDGEEDGRWARGHRSVRIRDAPRRRRNFGSASANIHPYLLLISKRTATCCSPG